MQVFVILPAAGLGTRMAGPQPKQFLSLNGLPILIHSLRAFAAVERVTAIYVAVRATEIERVEWRPRQTVYTMVGDLFAEICFALLALGLIAAYLRPRREEPVEGDDTTSTLISRNGLG